MFYLQIAEGYILSVLQYENTGVYVCFEVAASVPDAALNRDIGELGVSAVGTGGGITEISVLIYVGTVQHGAFFSDSAIAGFCKVTLHDGAVFQTERGVGVNTKLGFQYVGTRRHNDGERVSRIPSDGFL